MRRHISITVFGFVGALCKDELSDPALPELSHISYASHLHPITPLPNYGWARLEYLQILERSPIVNNCSRNDRGPNSGAPVAYSSQIHCDAYAHASIMQKTLRATTAGLQKGSRCGRKNISWALSQLFFLSVVAPCFALGCPGVFRRV